jgi:NitT/TauT family transport system permease protein
LAAARHYLWRTAYVEAAARTGLVKPLFFPAPSAIVSSSLDMMADGTLQQNAQATVVRVCLGLLLGGLPGMLLGLLMGWSPRLRAVVDPLVAAAHPVPKIAILPLIMIMFGIGEAPKIVVAAMGAFFPVVINTMVGVRQIHPIHFEVAKNYGASRRKVFTRVVLPGSLPMILTGLLLAANVTLLLTISVEMVSANTGLGAMIWAAWETMRVEELYVSLAIITLFGIGVHLVLERLTRALVPWRSERDA